MQKKELARVLAVVLGAGLAGGAAASGFQLLEQNASGLGNAYSGSAVVGENASTVYYNPAAMTKLEGRNFAVGAAFIKPSYKFSDGGSSNPGAPTGSQGGDAGGWANLPSMYATWQLNDKWFAGIGFGAPFGLKTEYDNDWVGRFQSLTFDIKTYNLNPSLAYKVNDKVSLGFGANYQRMEALYARRAASIAPAYQSTILTLDLTGEAFGWNAGATFKVSPTTDVGLSYRSKVFHRLHGTLTSTNQQISPDSLAMADITLPETYILSVSQKLSDRWEMMGDISRTNWSSMDKVAINRESGAIAQTLDAHFRDTWRVALGGTYQINDAWKWKYGVAYDQSPVRSAEDRLVSLPDNNRYWLSTGVQWKSGQASTIDLGLAYLYVPTIRIDNNQSSAPAYRGRVVGDYDGSILILGAQYSVKF